MSDWTTEPEDPKEPRNADMRAARDALWLHKDHLPDDYHERLKLSEDEWAQQLRVAGAIRRAYLDGYRKGYVAADNGEDPENPL